MLNLWHATSRFWTCTEPQLKLSWMKLWSIVSHYTTTSVDLGIILYIVLSEILTKNALEYAVHPTYFIGCCNCTSVQPCPQDFFMFVLCNVLLISTSCNFSVLIKPGFLNIPSPYKQTRSTFIRTLFILFYQFYSYIQLQMLITIIIIIIAIITVVIIAIIVISISSFLNILTFTVLVFHILLYIIV